MKLYPKKDPNAIDMLINYTAYSDLKFYHTNYHYFYGDENA